MKEIGIGLLYMLGTIWVVFGFLPVLVLLDDLHHTYLTPVEWFNDHSRNRTTTYVSLLWIITVSFLIGYIVLQDTRPCMEWGITTRYNPTTKIMQAVKYCKQYGEFINE